jgi:hypothetical protein
MISCVQWILASHTGFNQCMMKYSILIDSESSNPFLSEFDDLLTYLYVVLDPQMTVIHIFIQFLTGKTMQVPLFNCNSYSL